MRMYRFLFLLFTFCSTLLSLSAQEFYAEDTMFNEVQVDQRLNHQMRSVYDVFEHRGSRFTHGKVGSDPNEFGTPRSMGVHSIQSNINPVFLLNGSQVWNYRFIHPYHLESLGFLGLENQPLLGKQGSSGGILASTGLGLPADSSWHFRVSAEIGISTLSGNLPIATAEQYARNKNQNLNLGAQTDWINEITRTAPVANLSIGVSKQFGSHTFNASVIHQDLKGILRNSNQRQTHLMTSWEGGFFRDRLRGEVLFMQTDRFANLGIHNAFNYAMIYNPTAPVFDPDNLENGGYHESQNIFSFYNPVAIIEQNDDLQNDDFRFLQGRVSLDLTSSISLHSRVSRESLTSDVGRHSDPRAYFWYTTDRDYGEFELSTVDAWGQLKKKIGGVSINLELGHQYRLRETISLSYYTNERLQYDLTESSLSNYLEDMSLPGLEFNSAGSSIKQRSFFVTANVGFDKTSINVNANRVGTSSVGDRNQWATFYGMSVTQGVSLFNKDITFQGGFSVTGLEPFDDLYSKKVFDNDFFGTGSMVFYNGEFIPLTIQRQTANENLDYEHSRQIFLTTYIPLGSQLQVRAQWAHQRSSDFINFFSARELGPPVIGGQWANAEDASITNRSFSIGIDYSRAGEKVTCHAG